MRQARLGRPVVRRLGIAALIVVALLAILAGRISDPGGEHEGGALAKPIDRRQQTALAFGERSHWLQPWRAYLDTVPAERLRDAIGIQFNVEPHEADATARLLRESGFARARVEIGWDKMHPDGRRLRDPARLRTLVGALRRNGIRPLMLVNGNHGAPGPTRFFDAALARPAAAGARTVYLTRRTARLVAPGRSGLNRDDGKAADVLFTAVGADGRATLSKPLPRALSAGPHKAATLRYEPFGLPRLEDGRPNPRFEATLRGWLAYVRTVVRDTRAVLGSQRFDVEVWNEQSFGADFLHQQRYYEPSREEGTGEVTSAILRRTVRMLRSPSSPAPAIGIGDGFASQTPFPAGSTSPRGLTAIDKHPYYAIKRFPDDAVHDTIAPLDARGRPSYEERRASDGDPIRRDKFTPRYEAFFPEYILTGIQTETMIRDLSPITTAVHGTEHGRRTHPPGGRPPQVWITEANLDPTGADPTDPSKVGGGPIDRLGAADVRHLHAKAALRYYTAFVSKGVSAMHLFAAKDAKLGLVHPAFFSRLESSGAAYPGASAAGPTMRAVGRLARSVEGAGPAGKARPLSLLRVSEEHGNVQFEGDGTPPHPPLFDRDVTAFFPFQVRPGRYVAAAYVMTRNMAKLYRDGSGPGRYDLPAEQFRLTVGGLAATRVRAGATDPLTGSSVPVKIVDRGKRTVTLELPLTDSPRLITLVER